MFVRLFVLSILLGTTQVANATNYYLGINLGAASQDPKISVIDNSLDPDIPNITYQKEYIAPDESPAAQSAFIGYRLGQDIAIEFGFVSTDKAKGEYHAIDDGVATTNLFALDESEFSFNYLALVGVWPMGTHWRFNAKLGIASWQYDYSQSIGDVDTSTTPTTVTPVSTDTYSDSGSDFFYGVGLGYGINQHIDVRAEVMYLAFDPEFINVNVEQKMALFFLGAAYHF